MGSILNGSKLLEAQVEFSGIFNQALKITNPVDAAFDQLATEVRVKTKVVKHNWLGAVPGFRQWLDERPIGKLIADGYQITTHKWGNGLEIDEDDLEDDNLGLYAPAIRSLADEANVFKRERLVEYLIRGFTTATLGAGYDGVAFFADTHPNPGGNQSNLVHHTLDDTGALFEAYAKMLKIKNLAGRPANFRPTHLIFGPDNLANAMAALDSQYLANGASNPTYKLVQPLISPLLADYTAVGGIDASKFWFLVDLSRPLKPLIWQVRRDVRFRSVGKQAGEETSYENFLTGKLFFGADMRAEGGYGMWAAAVGSDGTT